MAGQVEQFGKYILLEKLAAGGMAEVYLSKTAGAVGVNKFVAIKRILPQYSGNQEFIEMFKEEAKICVNLNHGNVVSIFDFGMEIESFFLVMEFVPGKNLRQIINELKKLNKSFTTEQIVFIIKEVAAGLDHAHRCVDSATGRPLNITHRDMSPQNVMVSFEGEIKVIDFGIAKAETQLEATKAGTLKGKFGYMSPEQAEGFPIDPRTDVFALGIVLWELLANDRLFTASNEAAILRKIRDCQIPPIRKINPAVPPELERIVNKALAKDKNLRYQTAANFHRDLNRFLNTQYPDFSPHDFSVFIKDCFSQHYIDQRNKLVEYAKIQFNEEKFAASSNTNTSTSVTQAETSPDIADNRKTVVDLTRHDIDDSDENDPLELNTRGDHKVSLEGIRDQSAAPKNVSTKSGMVKKGHTIGHNTQYGGMGTRSNIPNVNSGMSRPTISGLPQAPKANSALDTITDILTKGVVSILLVMGGYYVFKTSGLQKQAECYLKTNALCKEQQPYTADPASTVKYGYTIYSDSGDIPNQADTAQIFIDGTDTKYTTPSRITVPGNRPLYIKIVKDGFVDYEKSVTVTADGQSLVATMSRKKLALAQPAPTTITVTLEKSTGGEQIFINGVRIQEKLPLTRYTVQPNTDLVIKVANPYTNQVDQRTVILNPGENKLIDFDFNRVRK